ncbi:MAG: phenylalanine--tRNA ligase subunit beta [bacterium]
MQTSFHWLKELVDFDYDPETLGHKLTMVGLECAKIEPLAPKMKKVVVGKVVSSETHPNAENLHVCQVEYGPEASLSIVCGAPNVREGMKAPLALVGSVIGGHKIKVVDKFGVKSEGMLCSEMELGLSDDHSGILELDSSMKLGADITKALGLDDQILHVDLTPNRPDCLSTIGIARDIAAICSSPLRYPKVELEEVERPAGDAVKIEIADPEACPRYAARVIENVQIGPSPWWIRQRLLAAGVRSINNVVDITNYVMMEYGHPLHAFDYDDFRKPEVLVRRAKEGEKFTTLDGVERILSRDVLLITDGEVPVAIGGVMGGEFSEVTAKTTRVLLESAYFEPRTIRRGRKFINLQSESQDRFERGADPNIVPVALDRAAALIARHAGGDVLAGIVDCYPDPIKPLQLELRPARVNHLLATDLSSPQMIDALKALEFDVKPGKTISVSVPTWRPDVTREIDLIEEVARITGYDNIPEQMLPGGELVTRRVESERFSDKVRESLLGQGLFEIVTNSIVDPKQVTQLGTNSAVELLNPLSEDLKWLRPELYTSLLNVVRHNRNHQVEGIKLFEIGNTFAPQGKAKPTESFRLGLAWCGSDSCENWTFHPGEFGFQDVRGALEVIAELTTAELTLNPGSHPVFAEGVCFEVKLADRMIGRCGQVDSTQSRAFGIKADVYLAELDLLRLFELRSGIPEFRELPRFPSTERDLAIVVAESAITSEVLRTIRASGGANLVDLLVFDLYRGKQVGKGLKSVAFRLIFRDESKTLTDEYIDRVFNEIVTALEKEHDAKLRA